MAALKPIADSLQLQNRDFSFFQGLFESRVLTIEHVAILFFNGSREAAKKRLQKIKAAGLIGERKRKSTDPSVLFLARKGLMVLQERGILTEYPAINLPALDKRSRVSEITLRHELEIMDVKAAFHAAIKNTKQFTVAEFNTWPLLYQFTTSRHGHGSDVLVKPDGFIRIHEREADGGLSEHTFFLELDRSTETQDTLINRAISYLEYYRSGDFAVRNGATRAEFKEFPFRVLIVLKSAERRNNLAERLAQNIPPILTQVWLTTFAEVTADPLGAIWIQSKDYREATKGTSFYSNQANRNFAYRRQSERELFVEKHIKKLRLLET